MQVSFTVVHKIQYQESKVYNNLKLQFLSRYKNLIIF